MFIAPILAILISCFSICVVGDKPMDTFWAVPAILLGYCACRQADKIAELVELNKDLQRLMIQERLEYLEQQMRRLFPPIPDSAQQDAVEANVERSKQLSQATRVPEQKKEWS
jgi:hypothetical protein